MHKYTWPEMCLRVVLIERFMDVEAADSCCLLISYVIFVKNEEGPSGYDSPSLAAFSDGSRFSSY